MVVTVATGCVCGAQAQDKAEVMKLVERFVALVRTHEPTPLAEIAAMLTEDFIQYGSDGSITTGRKANLQGYREGIQKTRAAFEVLTVEFRSLPVKVGGESAVVIGHLHMKGTLKNGGRPFARTHRLTLVFWRTDGAWKLLHKHSSVVPAKQK
jgi:ketosteroid isomerase-like protein